jgi:hypothetical protein
MDKLNRAARAARRLRRRDWVNYRELARIAGFGGWRTALSEARDVFGMVIENRLRRARNGSVISEYRYTRKAA